MAETTQRTSGLAIAGLVLGILAALTSFLPIINNLSAIIAVVGGILALVALIGALKGKHTSKGMSIAGIVLSVVSFAIVLATQAAYSSALQSAADSIKSGSQPVSSEAAGQQDADDSAPTPDTDWSNLAIGESATLDNGLTVTVDSVERVSKPYGDDMLLAAHVTYTNNGSDGASFNPLDWKSEDANGAQTSVYYNMADDQLDSGTLAEGGTVQGVIYFEGDPVKIMYYSNLFQSKASIGWVVA